MVDIHSTRKARVGGCALMAIIVSMLQGCSHSPSVIPGATSAQPPPGSTCALLDADLMSKLLGGKPVEHYRVAPVDNQPTVVNKSCSFQALPTDAPGSIATECGSAVDTLWQSYVTPKNGSVSLGDFPAQMYAVNGQPNNGVIFKRLPSGSCIIFVSLFVPVGQEAIVSALTRAYNSLVG